MTKCQFGRTPRFAVGSAIVGLALSACLAGPAAAGSLYVVAKLHVDVTAKNAVEAKKIAVVRAEKRAARILFKRLAPFNSSERLPRVKTGLIEDMLEGFSVRRERNSRTRYLATLDFTFRKQVVDQLLTGYGIPITDRQAPRLTILPVYMAKGRVVTSGRDPWRKAWLRLDLANAVVPLRLAQVTQSLTTDVANAILQGDSAAYAKLTEQYKTGRLVLAIAGIQDDGRLVTQLVGADQAGSISYRRQDRFRGKAFKSAARRSAEIVHGILEGRWKMARASGVAEQGDARPAPVSLIVEFSGLRAWQAIRSRLAAIPGVQAVSVGSLSARSAGVNLQFPGGVERLITVVASHQLFIENQGGAWVLRGN